MLGRGWDHSLWEGGAFPTATELDKITRDHPVYLARMCGHVGWANSRALDLAGITANTPDPPGGAISRDPETGEPIGILKEQAMDLIHRLLKEPSQAEATASHRACPNTAPG